MRRGQRSEKSEATWRKCHRASHCVRAADYPERWPEIDIWIQRPGGYTRSCSRRGAEGERAGGDRITVLGDSFAGGWFCRRERRRGRFAGSTSAESFVRWAGWLALAGTEHEMAVPVVTSLEPAGG